MLSLSVGRESLLAGVVDANGDVHAEPQIDRVPDQLALPPSELLRRIREAAQRAFQRARRDPALRQELAASGFLGVTVALPSPLARDGRARGFALSHREWQEFSVPARLATELGPYLPRVGAWDALNDANADAIAVGFDVARSKSGGPPDRYSEMLIAVRLDAGIGAGVIQLARYRPDGNFALNRSHLVVGSQGLAGELGHLPMSTSDLIEINTPPVTGLRPMRDLECSCGQVGHLEGRASSRSVLRRLHASGYPLDLRSLVDPQLERIVAQSDARQARALYDVGRLVGRALASPILMLDPRRVVLTGSLSCEHVRRGIQKEQDAWSTGVNNYVEVEPLGGERNRLSALRGAAIAVFRRSLFHSLDLPDAQRNPN